MLEKEKRSLGLGTHIHQLSVTSISRPLALATRYLKQIASQFLSIADPDVHLSHIKLLLWPSAYPYRQRLGLFQARVSKLMKRFTLGIVSV